MDNGFLGSGISAGFFELWNPVVLLLVVVVGALYVQAVGPWRQHFEGAEPVRFKHKLSFVTGLLLFYVAQGSPLAYVGHHYLFSAHMMQQSILYLIMPPLLLIGTPAWLVRFLLKPKWLGGIVKVSVKPLFALFWFNLVFSFYHIPFIMDAASVSNGTADCRLSNVVPCFLSAAGMGRLVRAEEDGLHFSQRHFADPSLCAHYFRGKAAVCDVHECNASFSLFAYGR
jgi:cytochrome c oxidase assembly factor CtaG